MKFSAGKKSINIKWMKEMDNALAFFFLDCGKMDEFNDDGCKFYV